MSQTALSLLIYAVGLVQGAMLVWVLLRNPFACFASGGYTAPEVDVIGAMALRADAELSKKRRGEVVISKEEAAKLFDSPAARQAILRVVARNGQRVER